jgi:general L-amino acid transport system permease protein
MVNMAARGIHSGWDFMKDSAGFDIGESLFAFDSADAYWRAFLIGFTNTLRVAVPGILLCTLLGALIGTGRLSRNALVRGLCLCYVEFFRNIPVLLQLLMWYLLFTEILPAPTAPMAWGPLYLSKGGLNFPIPVGANANYLLAIAISVGIVVALVYRHHTARATARTGIQRGRFWRPLGIVIGFGVLGWILGGARLEIDYPKQGPFAVENGGALTPEFLALLMGLSIYTAAFVAEVVRGGIESVPLGQTEAAAALGLSRSQILRRVTLPQALRVIIPPATNQFLNLTKNSSLAVVIGYPDVVSIANTAINQTGRAVECISVIMLVYLSTSLATSLGMNWFQRRSAIKER